MDEAESMTLAQLKSYIGAGGGGTAKDKNAGYQVDDVLLLEDPKHQASQPETNVGKVPMFSLYTNTANGLPVLDNSSKLDNYISISTAGAKGLIQVSDTDNFTIEDGELSLNTTLPNVAKIGGNAIYVSLNSTNGIIVDADDKEVNINGSTVKINDINITNAIQHGRVINVSPGTTNTSVVLKNEYGVDPYYNIHLVQESGSNIIFNPDSDFPGETVCTINLVITTETSKSISISSAGRWGMQIEPNKMYIIRFKVFPGAIAGMATGDAAFMFESINVLDISQNAE